LLARPRDAYFGCTDMRVHYPHGVFGPPVLDLAPQAVTYLFAEMDQIATELRAQPMFVESDLQIAFRQLQRARLPKLSHEGFLYAFEIWREHDRGQQVIVNTKWTARFEELCKERTEVFAERAAAPPQYYDMLPAKLMAIGCELAELQLRV